MRKLSIWSVGSMIIVTIIMLPYFESARHLFEPDSEIWAHIKNHLLKGYLINSTVLVLGTLLLSSLIAVTLAWVVTVYDFPFRNTLSLTLILPIAIPPYIGAFTYAGILSYTGPLQTFLRNTLNLDLPQKYFSIMNLWGAIFIFSIFLYPYIYLAARAFLDKNAAQLIESGRLLGDSDTRLFLRLILPLLRTPIIAGGTIVMLDVLSDYAVVSYFGIGTFSAAIFKTWQQLHDVNAALKLAFILILAVIVLTGLERFSRGQKKAAFASTKVRPIRPRQLNGSKRALVLIYIGITLFVSLLLPIIQMLVWSFHSYGNIRTKGLLKMVWNSFSLAAISATIILFFALIVANYRRLFPGLLPKSIARLSLIGYSIPSAVTGITVLVLFLTISPKLSRTLVMLIFAYVVRYFTIAFHNIDNGFEKVGLDFHQSSRSLGYNRWQTFWRIDLPMIRPALIGGFILTFVDIAKELTLTLILRPFNFYTLSTKVFEYAHDEMIPESSPASLLIIAISLIPLSLYTMSKKKRNSNVS